MFHLTPSEVDWAQVIGALGVLGIPVALGAIASAKRDLLAERRAAHELEVLRALGGVLLGRNDPENYGRCWQYLMMIPGSDDLALWRAALSARASDAAMAEFARRFPDAPPHRDDYLYSTARARAMKLDPGELQKELQTAIDNRLLSAPKARWRFF